jgi:soluble lytic murein transglycosylase-like protein
LTTTKLTASEILAAKLIQQVRLAPGIPTFWLPVSYVMAHVEIESGFNPTIKASDYASTGSVGLMQVEAATAAQTIKQFPKGFPQAPTSQTDPYTSLCTGMLYLEVCRNYLLPIFGAPLEYQHIAMAYNEGPGNAGAGVADPAYYYKWLSAQQRFAFLDMPAPTV